MCMCVCVRARVCACMHACMQMRQANVSPVFKKGEKYDAAN